MAALGAASSIEAADLRGRVLDPDGRTVARAILRLHDRASAAVVNATANPEGEYSFPSARPGAYLLEAESADRALGAAETVTIPTDGLDYDIQLAVRGPREQVVVTAAALPLAPEEIGKAAERVDRTEIDLRNEYSVGEALRSTAGLRVIQQGGPGSFVSLRFRGLRNQDTAVLIDGFRFRDTTGIQGDATGFNSDLIVADADGIEVMRGSGSSLYGSHALGGVIDIRSATGGGRPRGELRAEGGGLGFLRGVARVGGGVANDRLLYSVGLAHMNVTRGVDGFDPARNTSVQGFARWNFTPRMTLTGRVYGSDAFAALNGSPSRHASMAGNVPADGLIPAVGLPVAERERFETGQPFNAGNATFIPGPNDPDSRRTGRFLANALRLRHETTPRSAWELTYSGVDTERWFRNGPAGVGFQPQFNQRGLFDGRTDTLGAVGRFGAGTANALTAGYEFEDERYETFNTTEHPDPALRPTDRSIFRQRTQALYAHDQLRLLDGRLHIELAGRAQSFHLRQPLFEGGATVYDGVSLSQPPGALTGDASVSYFLRGAGTKLRGHAGNSYRNPAGFERFGSSFFAGSFSSFGDPRLAPERAASFDFGIDRYFSGARARLSATYFYTDLSETILFDSSGIVNPSTDPFGRFGGYRNGGGGISRGLETTAAARLWTGFDFTASYTRTNADSNTPTFGTAFHGMLGVSDHMFTMVANQRVGRFTVTADYFAASAYPFGFFGAPRPYSFQGPRKFDVVAGYDIPVSDRHNLRLYGKLENAFANTYWENGFLAPGRWGVAGLSFSF